jgi:hypothetical protein
VRHTSITPKTPNHSRKYSKALTSGRLLAPLKQTLQANADPEKWHASTHALQKRLTQLEIVKGPDHLAEVAYSWKNDLFGPVYGFRLIRYFVRSIERFKRITNRAQISCSIVNHRRHNKPFVEGS